MSRCRKAAGLRHFMKTVELPYVNHFLTIMVEFVYRRNMDVKTMKKLIGFFTAGAIALTSTQLLAQIENGMGAISGGGQLIEGANKISFGVWANNLPGVSVEGELQVNFHNTPAFSKVKFHGTMDGVPNFYYPGTNEETCNSAANVTFLGTLDGEPGYKVIFRVGEAGPPGHATLDAFDTVRITLTGPSYNYDTDGGGYTRQSTCVGTARTGLDRGNVTIDIVEPI